MLILERLKLNLNQKAFYGEDSDKIYTDLLLENGLDALDEYDKANCEIPLLETTYTILSAMANDVNSFIKVQTEFTTISAGYQYLQKRLEDLRSQIDRLKKENHFEESDGSSNGLVSYMFFNARKRGTNDE